MTLRLVKDGEAGPDPELAETWAAMKAEGDRMLAEGRLDGFWTYLDAGADSRGYTSSDEPLALLWAVRQAAEGRLDALVFGE